MGTILSTDDHLRTIAEVALRAAEARDTRAKAELMNLLWKQTDRLTVLAALCWDIRKPPADGRMTLRNPDRAASVGA